MTLSKGSMWRKWDFQVHTPCSYLHHEFGTDWDFYVKTFVEKAVECDVKAIGVTDYFCIDGYKKLRNEYLQDDGALNRLFEGNEEMIEKAKALYVFPNVEFRLNTFVLNKSVNFHVLFSDEVSPEVIEDYFLHEISFVYEGNPTDESYKMKLKIENLQELGRRVLSEQKGFEGQSELKVGMTCAVVDREDIAKVLQQNKLRFAGKYMIGLPPDEDLSKIDWASRDGQTRKVLIQGAEFLLASNANTISWALGMKHESLAEFKKEFGSAKPCLWGSDSHDYEKLLKPDEERWTWIKADLSFEGLKQVKYEPDERVFVGENQPDQKLESYTIDKVRFVQPSKRNFPPDWIEVNSNMTTIIGGKSAGKSLLLYYMAKTIAPDEALKLDKIMSGSPYDFDDDEDFDFEVLWTDGKTNKLSEEKEERKRRITYIPQMYINRLVEEERSGHLQDLIEDILLQNGDYKVAKELFLSRYQKTSDRLDAFIVQLLSVLEQHSQMGEKAKKLGDRAGVQKQIGLIQKRIEQLAKESDLSKDDLERYQQTSVKRDDLQKQMNANDEVIKNLEAFRVYIASDFKVCVERCLHGQIEEQTFDAEHQDEVGRALTPVSEEILSAISKLLSGQQENFFKDLQRRSEKKTEIIKRLKSLNEKLKPVEERIKNRALMKKLKQELDGQTKLLTQMDTVQRQKKHLLAKVGEIKKAIWTTRAEFKTIHEELQEAICALQIDSISEDIQLVATLKFDLSAFGDSLTPLVNLFDLRRRFEKKYDEHKQSITDFTMDDFKQLLEDVLSGDVRLKGDSDREGALRTILKNYISLDFNLRHAGDQFETMSPGKGGLVVLKLILHLSHSREPILIDQPEDNLDNRTIYYELNSYIKQKKKDRQIIMVTHNANLVVSADSEEVIVANQDGQEPGKDNRRYRFEYVSGPLEDTYQKPDEHGTLYQKGIRDHACEILEGGEEAFLSRQSKYAFSSEPR